MDGDKVIDIFLGGNFYKLKPEIGRHDGFNGGYFKGLGKGKYSFISAKNSGINVLGEVRDATIIDKNLLIARNNNSVLVFEVANIKGKP